MTVVDAARRYDQYWSDRDLARTQARSRSRAKIALELVRGSLGRRRDPAEKRSVLEVGCGPGFALEVFRDAGFDARGLDVSAEAVSLAKERGLDAAVVDIEAGDLEGTSADVVVAFEVLEHLVDPLTALERLVEHVRPGGVLAISLPNEFHLLRRASILLGRPGFGGHDDPHIRHFDDRLARQLFESAQLDVVARGCDSVVPPRNRVLRVLSAPLVAVLPNLFSISNVYVLEPRARGGET